MSHSMMGQGAMHQDVAAYALGVLDERDEASGEAGEGPSADETAAERLLAKKLPSLLREPDPRRRLQKAYALLARNGFAPDVCSGVSRRALAAEALDEPST